MTPPLDDADIAAYGALDTTFCVLSDQPDLLGFIDHLWAHARTRRDPEHTIEIVSSAEGWIVAVDGVTTGPACPTALVLARFHWAVNTLARAHPGDSVLLHAASVEIGGRGVVICGPSGSGKSTLALGLCERGAGYLSDEIAAVRRADISVGAYPKPLSLRPGSWPFATTLYPRLPAELVPFIADEWSLVMPVVRADVRAGLLVLLASGGADAGDATPVPRASALVELCEMAEDLAHAPSGSFGALADFVRSVEVLRLPVGELDTMCELVERAVA